MARIICSINAFLLLFAAVLSERVSIHDYILLITDVHKFYGTTCIMFVTSDDYIDLNVTTFIHAVSEVFPRNGIFTQTLTLSELPIRTEDYHTNTVRPLFVVLLTTKESANEFAKVTKRLDVSFPVWFLMFMQHSGDPLKDLCLRPTGNPFNLVFNTEMLILCYDQPKLKEWYALRDNQIRTFNLATWKPGKGTSFITNNSLYARRSNMFGEVMRIATVDESPFVGMEDDVLTKFFGEIIMELRKSTNFNLDILQPVSSYGNWNEEDVAWTGVIGELVRNVADFGCAEFSMTNRRLDVVDFTLPLMLSRNRVYFKRPDGSAVQWSGYLKAFSADIWIVIIALILTTPILLTLMKTRGYIRMRIMMENYIHVWGIYCSQGLSDVPKSFSLRLAFLSIFISALITTSAYSASLISFLTVTTATLPFSTIEEFVQDGSYKLTVFKNSADYDMFYNATEGIPLKLKDLLKKNRDLPVTLTEAFEQVCVEKVGFFTAEILYDAISIYLPCEVVFIEAGSADSLALTLTKGSPYTGLINYHIQRFKDNGVLKKLRATYLVGANPPEVSYTEVELWGVAPILAVLAFGMVVGCFTLFVEKIYYYSIDSKKDDRFVKKLDRTIQAKYHEVLKRHKRVEVQEGEQSDMYDERPAIGYWP